MLKVHARKKNISRASTGNSMASKLRKAQEEAKVTPLEDNSANAKESNKLTKNFISKSKEGKVAAKKRIHISKITKSARLGIKETPEMMALNQNSNGLDQPDGPTTINSNLGGPLSLAYRCKLCFKRFQHSSALGGHISKAHPGMSDAYNHKKRVRETRELERELHRHTMRIYNQTVA